MEIDAIPNKRHFGYLHSFRNATTSLPRRLYNKILYITLDALRIEQNHGKLPQGMAAGCPQQGAIRVGYLYRRQATCIDQFVYLDSK